MLDTNTRRKDGAHEIFLYMTKVYLKEWRGEPLLTSVHCMAHRAAADAITGVGLRKHLKRGGRATGLLNTNNYSEAAVRTTAQRAFNGGNGGR
jgi:hypothetical protein